MFDEDRPDEPVFQVRRSASPRSLSRPLVTPISPSVVYASPDTDSLDDQYEGRAEGFTYGREGHPNWTVLGARIDAMEGAPRPGVVTSSGMAAVAVLFQALLKQGDHVVAGNQLYGRSLRLLTEELPRWGVETTFVDATDGRAVRDALRPETRLVLVEAVSNPTVRIADMEAIAAATAEWPEVVLAVDNTFTTPRLYRPFEAGADVSIQSLTKMLAGHSDVTLGWVAARDAALARRLYDVAVSFGMTPSPFDCWLAERGLETFDVRLARAEATAARMAEMLAAHPAVERVIYPGRPDHPDQGRAQALFGGHGGHMLNFTLKGGRRAVDRLLSAAPEVAFAPTLGDVSTTLSHPPTSSHRGLSEEGRQALGIGQGFLRMSVGVEDTAAIVGEMARALDAVADDRPVDAETWREARAAIRSLTEGEDDPTPLMATVVCELFQRFERFDWVGFYVVRGPEMLKIGPYQGGHGCLTIPFSRGVCGAAARTRATQLVPDVEAFPGHIACAASTRSEIVAPVFDATGTLIAVLDIDSDRRDAFTEHDRAEVEAMLAEVFAR